MKILHAITLAELGGAQSVLFNLVQRSIDDGHEVLVVSSEGTAFWENLPKAVQKEAIPTLQRAINPIKDVLALQDLRRINKQFRPDVVHLHSSKMGFLGRLIFPAKKIIYTVHGFDSIRIAFRKFLRLEKILQRRARYIVAVSAYDYNNLLNEQINHNVSFIYNGISDFKNRTDLSIPDKTFLTAQKYIENKSGFKVLCIARMAAPKRFDLFCATARLLMHENVDFFWIGNKQKVDNLPSNVYCLGEVSNAHQLLPLVNIFMLASDYEGMPMSILEAISYGIPVVASDVGGISEILNGSNGVAVKNDPADFAHNILRYNTDNNFYERSKSDARKAYEENFTASKMYEAYIRLYKTICLM